MCPVLSAFQFITNMINVNITSVCQVSLSLHTLGWGGAKYSQSTRSPMGRTQPVYLTPSFSAHHSHPVCSFSLLSPPSSAVSFMVPAVSQLFSKKRCLYSPPMLSLLCLTFSFWISLSQSTQVLFASFIVFV